MRTLLAIVFSILIAGTQAAFPYAEGSAAPSTSVRPQCGCAKCETACCPLPAGRSSVPLPAVPSSARSQLDWQSLSERFALAFQILPGPAHIPAPPLNISSQGQVPLYEWNCAYLI